jgi:hypothetical protein
VIRSIVTGFAPATGGGPGVLTCAEAGPVARIANAVPSATKTLFTDIPFCVFTRT